MANQRKDDSEPDPTKAPEFQRVLGNMLKASPKPQSEMKVGRGSARRSAARKGDPKSA